MGYLNVNSFTCMCIIRDNAGLAKIINKLEKVYKGEGFDKILSRWVEMSSFLVE